MLAIQYALLEWVFRILMVIISAGQLAVILLSSTRHCVLETKELNLEGTWLFFLIMAQLFKIVTLTLWHLRLNQRNVGYFNDLMSHESSVFNTKGRDSNFLTTSQIAKKKKDHEQFKSLFLQATTVKRSGHGLIKAKRRAAQRHS